jgi:hypothetical protein
MLVSLLVWFIDFKILPVVVSGRNGVMSGVEANPFVSLVPAKPRPAKPAYLRNFLLLFFIICGILNYAMNAGNSS